MKNAELILLLSMPPQQTAEHSTDKRSFSSSFFQESTDNPSTTALNPKDINSDSDVEITTEQSTKRFSLQG